MLRAAQSSPKTYENRESVYKSETQKNNKTSHKMQLQNTVKNYRKLRIATKTQKKGSKGLKLPKNENRGKNPETLLQKSTKV